MLRHRVCLLLTGLAILLTTAGLRVADPPATQLAVFAQSLISTLDDQQKDQAILDFDSIDRVKWHFIPMESRKGLMLGDMNEAQRAATLRLLRGAVSEVGYRKADMIREMENVLHKLEGDKRVWARDPLMYYVTLFGTPGEKTTWGFSFEGHHLSLNFTCRDGAIVDSTPQFLAANPAVLMADVEGPLPQGTRILRDEETLAFDLVQSFNPGQLADATVADECPAEIRFAGEAQMAPHEIDGIRYGTLSAPQKEILRRLIETYIDVANDDIAQSRKALIQQDGWDDIRFGWAGATQPGQGHYYRIRGKSFVIDFINTQPDAMGNPANHIHCVWRDLTGDFDLPPLQ